MFGWSLNDKRRMEKRFRALEELLSDTCGDVGIIRTQIASLRAKIAVEAREKKKEDPVSIEKFLEEWYHGKVIGSIPVEEDKKSASGT